MKRIAVLQSFFLPWSGVFNQVVSVDVFVLGDDFQYTKNSWINRNRIKTPKGEWQWLTVPIVNHDAIRKKINEVEICYKTDWVKKHLATVQSVYRKAPHFDLVYPLFESAVQKKPVTIFDLNYDLMMQVLALTGIRTRITLRSSYQPLEVEKSQSLLQIVQAEQANHYLTGPSAENYLDEPLFEKNGISIEYQSYSPQAYPQIWGDFVQGLSILDVLMNAGPENARKIAAGEPL